MSATLDSLSPASHEARIKSILEWLALAHGHNGTEGINQLHRQLLLLREAPLPNPQRLKLLDLLYAQAERMANAELPRLLEVSLPIPRKLRQRVRILLDALEILTQDYLNTLADMFDPNGPSTPHAPHTSLRRAMYAIAWQARITHLIAAPSAIGLWQQLHSAYLTARRLGFADTPAPLGMPIIRKIYTDILLAAIAQPASFSPLELEFISQYISQCTPPLELSEAPPPDSDSVFWIDLDRDFPAHSLSRRSPSADARIIYFSCDSVSTNALKHRTELLGGAHAKALGLPEFADTHGGPAVLQRLHQLWGHPAKRRFPRRRQSYRAHLCAGLDNLWQLIRSPGSAGELSEWMVTNESPDGYALMHIAGRTDHLRVGDVIALQAVGEHAEIPPLWHICITRWAISENPEHIELGLQVLAPMAQAVEIAHPCATGPSSKVPALILPPTPPLRPSPSLVLPAGLLKENTRRIIVMVETGNLEIREVRATGLSEQTSSIEIFSVSPDD